jgi:hypothetical protein
LVFSIIWYQVFLVRQFTVGYPCKFVNSKSRPLSKDSHAMVGVLLKKIHCSDIWINWYMQTAKTDIIAERKAS